MESFALWDSDYRFMLLVWDAAPIGSGKLVDLCRKHLGWKKSTTYNAIRRMSEKGLIRNENAIVEVVIPKERVQTMESKAFLERTFAGSLPQFFSAFFRGKPLSDQEADELKKLIDEHRE